MPDTEAGKRLLSDNSIRISGIAPHPHGDWVINCWLCEAIAAIEAEAVAAERERIRAAVLTLPTLDLPSGVYVDLEDVIEEVGEART